MRNDENLRQERRLLYQKGNRLYQLNFEKRNLNPEKTSAPEPTTLTHGTLFRYAAGKLHSKTTLSTLKTRNNTYTTDMESSIV